MIDKPYSQRTMLEGLTETAQAWFFFAMIVMGLWVLLGGCSGPNAPAGANDGAITFVVPTPEPVRIFWIDSGGNIGLRGALAVVPGLPQPGAKLSPACEKSATANGLGTLTVRMEPIVGKTLAEKLDLDTWTSGTSPKP